MSVWVIVGLDAAVTTEKLGRHGTIFARIIGAVCHALAALGVVLPTIAHAVIPATGPNAMTTGM